MIIDRIKSFFRLLAFIFNNPVIVYRRIDSLMHEVSQIKEEQGQLLRERFDKELQQLIVFLVPPSDVINGGLMSICSIATESKSLEHVHHSKVIVAGFPKRDGVFLKYSKFNYDDFIYQFEETLNFFTNLRKIQIHIPEIMVRGVVRYLDKGKISLKHISEVSFNILNQNVELMPSPEIVARLKRYGSVTCTTAHSKYCTQEESIKYGIRYHHLMAYYHNKFYPRKYQDKENILVVSPDPHPLKEQILAKISKDHPNLILKIIKNMPYDEYKQWISRAKWSVTFGEGMDSYYSEPVLSGAVAFAVYNSTFFPNADFAQLRTSFSSYEEMLEKISSEIADLDNEDLFSELNAKELSLFVTECSREEHIGRIKQFYEGKYSYPNGAESSIT